MKRCILLLSVGLLFMACQMEYHAYDTRVDGPQQLHEKQLPAIERACSGKDEIRFAVLSDTQRWYDETQDAVHAINARDDIDFVIHGGDMADWGVRSEFERQRDMLLQLDVPFVVLLGVALVAEDDNQTDGHDADREADDADAGQLGVVVRDGEYALHERRFDLREEQAQHRGCR